ncbi:lysozyme inhibitor LprI family protein [Rossellomorea marisflavi]|uniref:lysozyme inhibitor LprI family protein n=1 Tax=Rossellomorea marisflavi TaxID=189381 RepID=UPI003458D1D1
MKWNKRIMIILVIAILATMTACKSSESSAAVQKQDETGEPKTEKGNTLSDSKAENKNQDAETAESESDSSHETTSSSEGDSTEESAQEESQSEDPKTNLAGMQSQYMKHLDETKATFEEEAELNKDYSTYELKYFEDRRFDAWDAQLNEIYGVLKVNLPTDQFDQLKEEQRLWIKSRDAGALEASETFKGTTSEHLEYSATLANLTESRCYDLVRTYMK